MLTVPDVARLMARNPETVRRWIREGKLPARKVGIQHLIDADDLSLVGYRPDVGVDRAGQYDIAAAVRRSRAERSAQIREAVPQYQPSTPSAADPMPAIVGRVVRLVDPERIVLFGSRAHGGAREDSDYDILVVMDELPDRRTTRIAIARSLADLGAAVDVVVGAKAELAPGRRGPRGIVQWAAEQGRVLYERA